MFDDPFYLSLQHDRTKLRNIYLLMDIRSDPYNSRRRRPERDANETFIQDISAWGEGEHHEHPAWTFTLDIVGQHMPRPDAPDDQDKFFHTMVSTGWFQASKHLVMHHEVVIKIPPPE